MSFDLFECRVSGSTCGVLQVRATYIFAPINSNGHGISEFLIHAADVEGLCQGIDEELVKSKNNLR